MNGLLIIDKPLGLTSFDVVARVRRATREKRVGHAGTLDPLATGVLPLALGKGTRVIEFLSEAGKEYRAGVVFGATSATYDGEGPLHEVTGAKLPAPEELAAALDGFRGAISQLPPMHSAVKHNGKRLYELARAGLEVERKPRPVTIYRLELLAYAPPRADLLIACSKGTYIRSLAHDLGQVLGCGAYLTSLIRTRHGPFSLADAHSLAEIEEWAAAGKLEPALLAPDTALAHLPRVDLDAERAAMVLHGREITAATAQDDQAVGRLYGPSGDFLALARWHAATASWKPEKVLFEHESDN